MKIGLIIAAVVAVSLVIGPVMMLRPNPQQKRKESLRASARAKGLHFSIRNLPQQADQMEKPDAMPVYFFAPKKQGEAPNWMLLRTHYHHEMHFLGWWAWHGDLRATDAELAILQAKLAQLPAGVAAVSGGAQGVHVYWDEKGDAADLDNIMAFLAELNALQ